MSVAYQGEPGAFSEVAAARFEAAATPVPCRTLKDVFTAVEAGAVDAGVVPVENSLAGSICETYDLLLAHRLVVTGETKIEVEHCLLGAPGAVLSGVREVLSHPQALAQCDNYLTALGVEAVPYYDTAGAARYVRQCASAEKAAIASRRAAEVYGLVMLAEGIQSNSDNYTRFYRVERNARPRGARNKTVIALGLAHRPGTLVRALSSFSDHGVNLTKIESRPVKDRPWRYTFYLEYEGHVEDDNVSAALARLQQHADMLRILGSFPVEG